MNARTKLTPAVAALALGLPVMISMPSVSHAAPMTFEVDTLSDNSADGLTLRDAINDANANPGADTITFAPGLTGTLTLATGVLAISDDVSIVGPGPSQLTVDANNSSGIFVSLAGNIDFALSAMTLTRGASVADGGAIELFEPNAVSIDDLHFVENVATGNGGAIALDDPTGPVEFSNSEFRDNTGGFAKDGGGIYIVGNGLINEPIDISNSSFTGHQADGFGGGVYIQAPARDISITDAVASNNRTLTGSAAGMHLDGRGVSVVNSTFDGNTAAGQVGGFLANANSDAVTLDGVTATNNTGAQTGGISASSPLTVRVIDSTIDDNIGGTVGGIHLFSLGTVWMHDTNVRGNQGGQQGGISLSPGTVRLSGLTVSGNTGSAGGGIGSISADVRLETSTVSGNSAGPGLGGGIFGLGGELTVATSTISGNSAATGGGIYAQGGLATVLFSTIVENSAGAESGGIHKIGISMPSFNRTILAGNTAPANPEVNGITIDAQSSIFGDTTGQTFSGSNNLANVDPKLGPLADNTGPTLTHLPMPGSPAINAGGGIIFEMVQFDQRGRPRPAGVLDIGSVEVSDVTNSIWVPVEPARIVDTRSNGETIDDVDEKGGKLGPADEIRFEVASRAGVPADAKAVVANITAVQPDDDGFITGHPCVTPRPLTASLNYTAGANLGNETIIGLDAGDLCIFTHASTHITVDVVGYVPADSEYEPNEPVRLLDTRPNGVTFDGMQQAEGAPGAGNVVEVTIRGGVSKLSTAVVYVTAIGADETGFVTVWNCLGDRPLASSLNHVAGVNRGNEIVAGVDNGKICIYTQSDVDLTVDLVGSFRETNYFSLDNPSRILDTRSVGETVDDLFEGDGVLGAGQVLTLDVAGRAGVHPTADTVTVNITAVRPDGVGFVTVSPCGTLPLAASLNYVPGVNGGNEVVASLSDAGQICLFTHSTTHLTADVTGWTAP